MIKEDYVSFEIAKLLKEKGFDVECHGYYDTTKHFDYMLEHSASEMDSNDGPDCYISAPTLQMAMKWLREKGIIITVVYTRYSLQTIGAQLMFGFNIQNVHGESFFENVEVAYCSYEQAEMDAIKYCLENLI